MANAENRHRLVVPSLGSTNMDQAIAHGDSQSRLSGSTPATLALVAP